MIHKDTFNKNFDFVGSKGVVFVEKKMLAYRGDGNTDLSPHLIDLPGGGREGDESPFDTFRREIQEEFGIGIEKDDVSASYVHQNRQGGINFFFITKDLG